MRLMIGLSHEMNKGSALWPDWEHFAGRLRATQSLRLIWLSAVSPFRDKKFCKSTWLSGVNVSTKSFSFSLPILSRATYLFCRRRHKVSVQTIWGIFSVEISQTYSGRLNLTRIMDFTKTLPMKTVDRRIIRTLLPDIGYCFLSRSQSENQSQIAKKTLW